MPVVSSIAGGGVWEVLPELIFFVNQSGKILKSSASSL